MWNKCVEFHGHECGGLAIGYQAALYAIELLDITKAKDEEIVCITENDACGVDAIQVMLGCSLGKGNLLIKMRGKQAFSIFNRKTGKSVRLVLREMPELSRQERMEKLMRGDYHELFDVKETVDILPVKAKIFESVYCENCGEKTSENYIRLQGGKKLCLDCFEGYSRFLD